MKEDYLSIKIAHYCNYVNSAVSNFRKGSFADAALNGRKAAEAACKIIIYHALNPRMAENKIGDKGLAELIQTLIRDGFAARKAIHTLQALQITGNQAAHDNQLSKEETSYALNALQMLTDMLFTDHLKIKIPSAINFKEPEEIKVTPEIIEKIIIQEKIIHQKLDKESELELINKIRHLNQEELNRHEELFKKQQNSIIEELNEIRRRSEA